MTNDQIFIGVAQGNSLSGAALCAVRLEERCYRVLALRSVAHDNVAGAVKALRRELAAAVTPEPVEPFVREVAASSSREWREAREAREQREAQRVARRELELTQVGATYAVKTGGTPDMPHVWALMRQEVIRPASRDVQEPLGWIKRALEHDGDVGVYGLALGRAILLAASGG